MKKAFAILAGSVALIASQTAVASEDYIIPNAPFVFEGSVNVNKGIPLTCDVVLTVTGPNDAADTTPNFNHTDLANATIDIVLSGGFLGLCGSVIVDPVTGADINYTRSSDTAGTFTLTNVFVDTPTPGDCLGTITASWAQGSPSTLSVSGSLPPATPGTANCTMSGSLDLTSPANGDVRDSGDSDHNPHK